MSHDSNSGFVGTKYPLLYKLSESIPIRKSKQQQKNHALKALGEALRNRRAQLKLTQEEVGKAAELHRTYITDVENGLRNFSFLTLLRLAKALECAPSQIMSETEKSDNWEL